MSSDSLELPLKADWDYFPHYSKPLGHFVGRIEEKEKILNWFTRREKGCFLVCGERGVGKTSLIYEALREAIDHDKKIIPIIITASQLIESDFVPTQTATPKQINSLKERIIVNLIRRLYADLIKKASGEIKKDLENLYKKAVCSKAEIKERQKFEDEASRTEETESGAKIETHIDPNQFKYVVSSLLAVGGVNLLYLHPFWGQFGINIFFATILLFCPISATLYIQQKIKEHKRVRRASSVDLLYISDRSVGNLTYDLQSFLETPNKVWKIIVVVDEMDKLEDGREEDLIKTFKNLFTLSNGLFVFISSNKAYDRVEYAKINRGVSYTLYNDRIFITRPNSNDLEEYIDRIVENQSTDILTDKRYRNFRNLICYQSRSDFFELQYRIRDYIHNYDTKNRPILRIDPLSIDDTKQANLQKVIGQIFNLNRFEESSNWIKNNTLLNCLYCLVDTPMKLKEHTKWLKTENNELQTRIIGACDNLLDYLLRLKYITGKEKRVEDVPNEPLFNTTYFHFGWTGAIGDIPKQPETPLDYEENFITKMSTISKIVNEIAEQDLKLENKVLDVRKSDGSMSQHSIQPLCDLDPRDTYKAKLVYKLGIKQKSPKHFPREELEKFTKEIDNQILHINNSVATIAMRLINQKLKLKNYGPSSRLEKNTAIFGGPMQLIRNAIIEKAIIHDCLFRPNFVHQILITQDMPEDLYNENKGLINSTSNHHLIINLNTKGTKYNLEFKANKSKKIEGFIDIPIYESFSNLQKLFEILNDLDFKDFKFPEAKEDELTQSAST